MSSTQLLTYLNPCIKVPEVSDFGFWLVVLVFPVGPYEIVRSNLRLFYVFLIDFVFMGENDIVKGIS